MCTWDMGEPVGLCAMYACVHECVCVCVCVRCPCSQNGSAREHVLVGMLMCVHGEDLSGCFCEFYGDV